MTVLWHRSRIWDTDRSRELSYQDEVCLTVPNGGEAVSDTVYNDVENAMNTLQTMHVSYLNRMYDETVLKKWKNQPYEDTTGYDYIGAHLGYRYEISGLGPGGDQLPNGCRINIISLRVNIRKDRLCTGIL